LDGGRESVAVEQLMARAKLAMIELSASISHMRYLDEELMRTLDNYRDIEGAKNEVRWKLAGLIPKLEKLTEWLG
jgi:hypothetical protein